MTVGTVRSRVAKKSVSTTAQSRAFKDKSRAAFDRQAPDYDTGMSGRHARRLHGDVLAALGGSDFDALLDVGCGTGLLLERVHELRPAARLAGVDLSEAMLDVAGRRLGGAADLRLADAEHLPQPDGAVDAVVCVDSFHHYPDPAAALAEMRRVTRPGGALVLGEWRVAAPFRQLMNAVFPRMPEGDVRVYSGAELTALLEAAGYRVTRCARAGVRGQLLVAGC